MATKPRTTKNKRKKTMPKWDGPKDPTTEKAAGKYPNQHVKRTRSGHTIIMDDSEDAEHIKIQHRSGSALVFHPDGAISMTTHKGQYHVVFGEHRMTVTGAHDITVKGDGSMRVYGDFNKTVHGDYNMTVTGNHNTVVGGSCNKHVNGDEDKVIGGNKTTKTRGSIVSAAKETNSVVGGSDVSLASQTKTATVAGKSGVGVSSSSGPITAHAKSNIGLKTMAKMDVEAQSTKFKVADFHVKSEGEINTDGSKQYLNSGKAQDAKVDDLPEATNSPNPQGPPDNSAAHSKLA